MKQNRQKVKDWILNRRMPWPSNYYNPKAREITPVVHDGLKTYATLVVEFAERGVVGDGNRRVHRGATI